MTRSLKKGPYIDEKLLKKIKNLKPGGKEIIKTWSRSATITPEMVGFTFGVHNGKVFNPVKVTEEIVGFKLLFFTPGINPSLANSLKQIRHKPKSLR